MKISTLLVEALSLAAAFSTHGAPPATADAPACPGPAKLACSIAEPQSPRDLTTDAPGMKTPQASVLNIEQVEYMPMTNIHFHLGSEHKSDEYSISTDSDAWDATHDYDAPDEHDGGDNPLDTRRRRLTGDDAVRPGFMCPSDKLKEEELAPYEFQHCKGEMEVGKSYEVHYVHSSAGDGSLTDGLGQAAGGRGQLNPMVAVQNQVFLLVNDPDSEVVDLSNWDTMDHGKLVMYMGSTTGGSHDNEVCSPYQISWHVDLECHTVSAQSFDNMCKYLAEQGLVNDLIAHGSRKLVSPEWVVKPEYVFPM